MFKNIEDYYFSPSAFSLSQSAYGSKTYSDYLCLSVRSGAKIRVRGTVKTRNPLYESNGQRIGYNSDLEPREWTFTGGNIKLSDRYADRRLYLYIRVDAATTGTTGDLFFSQNNYDFDGYLLEGDGQEGVAYKPEPSADEQPKGEFKYFYIAIGVLSEQRDNNGQPGYREYTPWDSTSAGGEFGTSKQDDTVRSDFFDAEGNTVKLKSAFNNFHIPNGFFQLGHTVIYGIRRAVDGLNEWADDNHLATTASIAQYISNALAALDSKYLRKDQDDTSPYRVIVGDLEVEHGLPRADGSQSTGNLSVDMDATVGGNMALGGNASVYKDLSVRGAASVRGNATVNGDTTMKGSLNRSYGDLEFGSGNPEDVGSYDSAGSGCKIYWTGTGWRVDTDYLSVNKKMYAKEIEVDKVTHVGGEQILTAASCVADHVTEYKDAVGNVSAYIVFFRREDSDGRCVTNDWMAGDLAYCQTFNIEPGVTKDFSNRYYWRLVLEAGVYPEQPSDDTERWNYIILSNEPGEFDDAGQVSRSDSPSVQSEVRSDAPQAEDHIVQFGFKPGFNPEVDEATVTERQGATLLSGSGKYGRAIIMWEQISTFKLPPHRLLISPSKVDMIVNSLSIKTAGTTKTLQQYINQDLGLNFEGRLIINGDDASAPTTDDEFIQAILAIAYGDDAAGHSISDLEGAVYITTEKMFYMLTYDAERGQYTWLDDTDGTLKSLYEKYDSLSIEVNNILYDGCITYDEKLTLWTTWRQLYDYQSTASTKTAEQYGSDAAWEKAWLAFWTASQKCTNMMEAIGITIGDKPTEEVVYFKDAGDVPAGAKVIDYTRSDMMSNISDVVTSFNNFMAACADFNVNHISDAAASAALGSATQLVTEKITEITQGALDQRMIEQVIPAWYEQSLQQDVVGLLSFQNSASSQLETQDESVKALTQWVGEDFASSAGLVTYLNTVFVGTDQVNMVQDKDSEGHLLYQPVKQKEKNGKPLFWKPVKADDGTMSYIESEQSQDASGNKYDKVYVGDYSQDPVSETSQAFKDAPNQYVKRMVVENRSTSGLVTSADFASLFAKKLDEDGRILAIAEMATYVDKVYWETLPSDIIPKRKSGADFWYSPSMDKNFYQSREIEDISQGSFYSIRSNATISADNVFISSGSKSMGDYFSLRNGSLWCQDITLEGVLNTLYQSISDAEDFKKFIIPAIAGAFIAHRQHFVIFDRDDYKFEGSLDPIHDSVQISYNEQVVEVDTASILADSTSKHFSTVHYGSGYQLYGSLDVLLIDGIFQINATPAILNTEDGTLVDGYKQNAYDYYLVLPYLERELHNIKFIRTATRFGTEELHYITYAEIQTLIGREIILQNNTENYVHLQLGPKVSDLVSIPGKKSVKIRFVMDMSDPYEATTVTPIDGVHSFHVALPIYHFILVDTMNDAPVFNNFIGSAELTDENFGLDIRL